MSGPQVYLSWPTSFTPFPNSIPSTVPPPITEGTFRSPFAINKHLYNAVLRPELPILFATSYIVLVFSLNAYNKSHGYKPWRIAKQKPFQWFVVVHNILLTIYSFATFFAMGRAITETWPGLDNEAGLAGVADALCKLHGPRGMGDAATFNTTINIWEVKNRLIHVGYDGNPDPTDVGRLWNEGLAFWGWLFYVSKFYEVIDTLIIVAKGKRSATLQTYHHAGAMLCMWAGIRYMSPPIWMFVFINSGIHALMYTYFTLSALGIRVPTPLKRTLTSLQIAQFVFGASYAAAHLFVQYDIPIHTPYQVASTLQAAASSVSSAAAAAVTSVSSFVESPVPTAPLGALFKKLLLRAAGEEGVAERVHNDRGELLTPHMEEKIEQFNEQTYETHWRTDWTKIDCIDTSGEAFAIYLNLFYLLPLTWLFGRFFVRAYTQRGKPRTTSQAAKQVTDSAKEAQRKAKATIEDSGEKAEDELARRSSHAKKKGEKQVADLQEQLREDVRRMKEGTAREAKSLQDRATRYESHTKSSAEKVRSKADGSGSGSRRESPSKRGGEGTHGESENEPEESRGAQSGGADSMSRSSNDWYKNEERIYRSSRGSGTQSESEAKQDDILAASETIRPGATEESQTVETIVREEDTDAMGKSGSIIDIAREEFKNVVEGLTDTVTTADPGSVVDFTKDKAADAIDKAQDEDEENDGGSAGGLLSPSRS